jgi:hypothetical protein
MDREAAKKTLRGTWHSGYKIPITERKTMKTIPGPIENKIMTAEMFNNMMTRSTHFKNPKFHQAVCFNVFAIDRKSWGAQADLYSEVWNILYYASIAMPDSELLQLPQHFQNAILSI